MEEQRPSGLSAVLQTFKCAQRDRIKLQVGAGGEGRIVWTSIAHSTPSSHVNAFQMWLHSTLRRAHLEKCYRQPHSVHTVLTCYDPVHLLQGGSQHLAGVRHHLGLNGSGRGKTSENHEVEGKDSKLEESEEALKSANGGARPS